MRRPATTAAGAFGTGILSAYMSDVYIVLWLILLTVILIFLVYSYLDRMYATYRTAAFVLCMVVAGGSWLELGDIRQDPLIKNIGGACELTGTVVEADFEDDLCELVISRDGYKSIVKYYGEHRELKDCIGMRIKIHGSVELPMEQRNPGCFNYRLYLRSCKIQTIIKAERIEITHGKEVPYLKWAGKIRNTFKEKTAEYIDETNQGLIMAIMFGDKTMLDEDIYSDFQKNGTAHILAVSGLHTGIIYAFFVYLWKGKKGMLFYSVVTILLLLYMSLADFSPSVVRAVCMILLHLLSQILKCRYDLLTSASITFITMLIINPYQLFHVGFQMSFLAVASLAFMLPFIKRIYQGVFLTAIAIQAGMMPYTAFVFNYVSIGSVLANIPVIFIAGIMLPVALCALISMNTFEEGFAYLITMVDLCCDLLIKVNDVLYIPGVTSFEVMSPPVWILILYYESLFFFISETGQLMVIRKNVKKMIYVIISILTVSVISGFAVNSHFKDADIIFVDVGQGDCIHIRTDSGRNYLIDGGGSTTYDVGMETLKPYLLKNGVKKIDTAFVTHLHEDHYGGIRSLEKDGMIEKIAVFDANRENRELRTENAELIYLHRGNRVILDEGVFVDIIYPEKGTDEEYKKMVDNEEDENESSLIMKLNCKGYSVLITGDIDEKGEKELIGKYKAELDCDIMKVPHHGSKYSSSEEFVDVSSPELAVFQVGKNNYGHPSEEIVKRYQRRACITMRNDLQGAIGVILREDGMKVIEMID